MKSKILTTSIIFAMCATLYSADLTGGTTAGARTTLIDGDLNLVAPSGVTSGTLYYKGNTTPLARVSKLTTVAGLSYNIAGGFIIDTNSATEAIAIEDTSTLLQFGNYLTPTSAITVENTKKATTVFNVNNFVLTRPNGALASTNLQINTSLTVNVGNSFKQLAGSSEPATKNAQIMISNGSTLKFVGGTFHQDANTQMMIFASAKLDMGSVATLNGITNVNGSLAVNGNMTYKSGSQLYFRQTAGVVTNLTFGAGKKITMENGSTFTVDSPVNLTLDDSNFGINQKTNLDIAGTVTYNKSNETIGSLTMGNLNLTGSLKLSEKYSKANVYGGTTMTLGKNSKYEASGGISLLGGVLNIEDGANIKMTDINNGTDKGRIVVTVNSTINFNGTATFKRYFSDGSSTNGLLVFYHPSQTSVVNINAANHLGQLYISGGNVDMVLDDIATNIMEIDQIDISSAASILNIKNFKENRIKVNGSAFADNIATQVKLMDSDGNIIGIAGIKDGWLSNVAVPEPAEWAAIFGVFAMAFAAWRKRKA